MNSMKTSVRKPDRFFIVGKQGQATISPDRACCWPCCTISDCTVYVQRGVWLLACCLVLFRGVEVAAAEPVLSGISPAGCQRGTEAVLQFNGQRLEDAQGLLFYSPGVSVAELKPADDKRIEVRLNVSPDCRLGFHAVRVRTASGISNLRTFSVGQLKEIQEAEPNSEFAQPQSVELDTTINGVVTNEDIDYFVVAAKKGERINVEVEGVRLGNDTFFDPFVAILDSERFELARSDDAALLQQDCVCGITVPEDGNYIIQLRETAFGGNDNCKYRLHVGRFPRPRAVLPAGGKPGEQLEVTWIGDPKGVFTSTVTLPTDDRTDFGLFATDDHGVSPSPNHVRVCDLQNVMETEPNDARDKSQVVTVPAAINGSIERPGDTDHFKFAATKGQVFDVQVYARNLLRSPLDSVINISRANGGGVGGNDDSGGLDSYLRFTAPEDDDYVLVIRDQLLDGGPEFVYRVEIAPVAPKLELTLPERRQYEPITISVPQGNRMAVMVNAVRRDLGGPVEISCEGLPAGISAEPVTVADGQASVPLLLSATEDAAPDGSLVDMVGRVTVGDRTVVGHLNQRTMLVRGQNNRDVWGHDADRAAIAVTQRVPFSIQIRQPQVPIVRSGSMQLVVEAQRDEGFAEPIHISMLYNPNGIGSSGSISIPADKTEMAIPLTANGNAALGTWPIIVLGRAKVGNGDVLVASQQAQLEVSDTFFNLTFEKAAAELNQEASLLVRIEQKQDFEGAATVKLVGLPAKTSCSVESLEFTKDATDVAFPVKIGEDARPGKYQTLVCQAVVMKNGEPINHTFGGGELRIDKPLPPPVEKPKAEPAAEPKPEPKPPAEKPLSRLEQLRQRRNQ
jgi:hypothetical protein